jgi:transglutaminase-like putative cysteine protease
MHEDENGLPVELFRIDGTPGSSYLRTNVGEYYDGLWDILRPSPREYSGELLTHNVSGTRTPHQYTITPIAEMGGFIPTVKYTNALSLDHNIKVYPDQLTFFSSVALREPYVVTSSSYRSTEDTMRYLNVPESLVSIFRDLAISATDGVETPYEKYKALETFLRTTYEYDINFSRAPPGIDPVEWFLFHEKRGACANFNSAFVLLARSIGLPARLVRGYAIDAKSYRQVVNSTQSHIYSEAPFEGIGWITFDATGFSYRNISDSNGDTNGEEEPEIEPIDEESNETDGQTCINLSSTCSAEGGLPPKVDLFYIYGITGTSYLRTGVGEQYEGIWKLIDPSPRPFRNELLSYPVTDYSEATKYRFMIAPIVEMGGFIPSAQYTNELLLDYPSNWYPDQQLFFTSRIFTAPYIVDHTEYDFSEQTLLEASLREDSRYLNIPPSLEEQLRILALNVTDGIGPQYLQIVALRDYLKFTYKYDINYTRAPPSIDPVEWFLFHEKRGVCANFNSAFVLLARSIGLPARYVVGYAVKPGVETQKVTSIARHAYAEFPFNDLGWIIFDATGPGFLPFEDEPVIPPLIETFTEIREQDTLGVKGLEFRVAGSVVDENGDPVEGLQTLIYLKESKEENGLLCGEGAVINGWFNITCTLPMNLTNGYYLVQAHTLGNQVYNGSWSDPPLKVVTKSELTLDAPNKVITGREFIFQGNLTEYLTGDPIENKICNLQVNGAPIPFETNVEGYYKETYTLEETGEHVLKVEWPGEDFYLNSSASSIVRSVPLKISPDEIEMMIRQEEVIIKGRVHAEELSGDYETVRLTINSTEIGTANTDKNGIFTYSYIIPRTHSLGRVLIEYSLESQPNTINQTSFVYARTNLNLDVPDPIKLKEDYTLQAALTDDLGNPISRVNITVENKEEMWNTTLLTNINGEIEVPLKINKEQNFTQLTYQAFFEGIDYYLESSDEVVATLSIPEKRTINVLGYVTRSLVLVAIGLLSYTAYKAYQKRRKPTDDEVDETIEPQDPLPQIELSAGIKKLDERFLINFPQIAPSFPIVWEAEEKFVIQLGLVQGKETFSGTLDAKLTIESEDVLTTTLYSDRTVEYSHFFKEKGFQEIQLIFEEQGTSKIAIQAIVKIVDYREEVNDLFNDEFEEYRDLRDEIEHHFTAREFMHSILENIEASERYYGPLNEMVSVFEIADYSLHDVKRDDYERFLYAKNDFEEIKIGI